MSKEIRITFPDGNHKVMHSGITPLDVAKSISLGLSKSLLAVKYNNELIEPNSPLSNDGKINLFTFDDFEGKKSFWHSSSHIMAQVLEELYPGIKLTIGPPIENGFYYDVDLEENKISENDFPKIEKRMLEIAREKHNFYLKNISKSEAIKYYTDKKNEYKIELLNDLNDGEITFCYHDSFCDLCKGGHIIESSIIKAVKILNVAGAYWKGDENNKQLTRIYGISFPKKKTKTLPIQER
jgi:threonyl-tRNA synthetase